MTPADAKLTGIHCRLDELLAERGMTLTALAEQVGVSIVNLSVLKNDRAKAIRFSTLVAICDALEVRGDMARDEDGMSWHGNEIAQLV